MIVNWEDSTAVSAAHSSQFVIIVVSPAV